MKREKSALMQAAEAVERVKGIDMKRALRIRELTIRVNEKAEDQIVSLEASLPPEVRAIYDKLMEVEE